MKRLFKISQGLLIVITLCTIVFTETGCSSHQKGYNYKAHNNRNKTGQRHQNKRLKKAGGDQLKFTYPKFKKK